MYSWWAARTSARQHVSTPVRHHGACFVSRTVTAPQPHPCMFTGTNVQNKRQHMCVPVCAKGRGQSLRVLAQARKGHTVRRQEDAVQGLKYLLLSFRVTQPAKQNRHVVPVGRTVHIIYYIHSESGPDYIETREKNNDSKHFISGSWGLHRTGGTCRVIGQIPLRRDRIANSREAKARRVLSCR